VHPSCFSASALTLTPPFFAPPRFLHHTALAHQQGPSGLYAAHLWLAQLLDHLADQISPTGTTNPLDDNAADATGSAAGSSYNSGSSSSGGSKVAAQKQQGSTAATLLASTAAPSPDAERRRRQQADQDQKQLRDPWLQLQGATGRGRLGPVTAAGAAAAAAELRAAAAAAAGSWRGAALTLPPDLQAGMFTPAVLEAYPAAARAVDAALAQTSACNALEVRSLPFPYSHVVLPRSVVLLCCWAAACWV
jgi:hypothetical protein